VALGNEEGESKSKMKKKKKKKKKKKIVPFISPGTPLVDIGINLGKPNLANISEIARLEEMFERAIEANVGFMLATGTSVAISRSAIAIAEKYPALLRATVGIHPHHAKSFGKDSLRDLRRLLSSESACSIGETGLDYNRMRSTKEEQQRCFRAHVALALDTGKPMFIHEREAHDDLVKILEEFDDGEEGKKKQSLKICVHCFTGSEEELRYYVSRGYYIGITGFIAMKSRGERLREAVRRKALPLSQLMIETDSPYMCPDHPQCKVYKRSRNEPCTLGITAQTLAECYDISVEKLAAETTQNAVEFFRLPEITKTLHQEGKSSNGSSNKNRNSRRGFRGKFWGQRSSRMRGRRGGRRRNDLKKNDATAFI